jgi:hypothetical protein
MTREEQVAICRTCEHCTIDIDQGYLCGLTNGVATFDGECSNYSYDASDFSVDSGITDLAPEVVEKLKMEQRLVPGILGASIAGIIGAVVWGMISVVTNYQIGFMALAVGAGVGFAMRIFGRGIEPIFGILGGVISLISVLLGNFLTMIGFIAIYQELGYFETLLLFDYSYLIDAMVEMGSGIDLLFYGIAVYEGYRFSFRKVLINDPLGEQDE